MESLDITNYFLAVAFAPIILSVAFAIITTFEEGR